MCMSARYAERQSEEVGRDGSLVYGKLRLRTGRAPARFLVRPRKKQSRASSSGERGEGEDRSRESEARWGLV
jgi:hypothetical protein